MGHLFISSFQRKQENIALMVSERSSFMSRPVEYSNRRTDFFSEIKKKKMQ